MVYSGDTLFKLLRGPEGQVAEIHTNPYEDNQRFTAELPDWQGTVIGIDISVDPRSDFADFLATVGKSYKIGVKRRKKDFFKRIRFEK